MKLVIATDEGTLELNTMWLPTWIGINRPLIEELQKKLSEEFVGKPLTESLLREASDRASVLLQERFPTLYGLEELLDSLKFLRFASSK